MIIKSLQKYSLKRHKRKASKDHAKDESLNASLDYSCGSDIVEAHLEKLPNAKKLALKSQIDKSLQDNYRSAKIILDVAQHYQNYSSSQNSVDE